MNFIFGRGTKFLEFATKLSELMWLNFLTFLCCLPVFTIGAATSAMHTVLIQIFRDEESQITATFFKAFKKNFKQATLVWLIYLATYLLLWLDHRAMQVLENSTLNYLDLFVPVMVFIITLSFSWAFVLQCRYNLTIKDIFIFSFTRIIAFPIRTLFMGLCIILPIAFALIFPSYQILVVLLGIAVPGITQTCFYNKALKVMEDDSATEEKNEEVNSED